MALRLEDWACRTEPNPYLAPELRSTVLTGIVYNHPDFKDGQRITTAPIKGRLGNLVVTLTGSRYELGTPNANYEKKYPGAKERILQNLRLLK